MDLRELRIILTVGGPVLTRATSPGSPGVDAPVARSADDRPLLPGSLIKGKLREAWDELSSLAPDLFQLPAGDWLGTVSPASSWGPQRGRLVFSDFVAPDAAGDRLRHRIAIDDALGAVKPNFLQVVETPYAAGATIHFTGSVTFVPRDDDEAAQIWHALDRGLRWITSVGGLRTVGFGRLEGVAIEEASPKEEVIPEEIPAAADAFFSRARDGADLNRTLLDLEIEPLGPFLVTAPGPVDNLFESLSYLPGNVLKGALASTWNERQGRRPGAPIDEDTDPARPELGRHFHRLRLTHAFRRPGEHRLRPVVPPLSLVKVRRSEESIDVVYDVLFLSGAAVFRGEEPNGWVAPSFKVDWKRTSDVAGLCGGSSPDRTLTVRTAMDPETRRAADEQLFAQERVVPRPGDVWLARVDLSRVPDGDQKTVARQLGEVLAGGLRHVGKMHTAAHARLLAPAIENGVRAACFRRKDRAPDGFRTLSLQSAAVILDPRRLTAPRVDLQAEYREAWRQLSDGSLEMVRCFTRHRLAGGRYLHQRFQPGKPYEPYLLTSEGSVFLLRPVEGREDDADACLAGWEQAGIALLEWAAERYRVGSVPGSDWRACPYIPENGFGEIVLDRELHWTWMPAARTYTLVDGEEAENAQ